MYLVEKCKVLYRVFETFHHKTDLKTLKKHLQNTE